MSTGICRSVSFRNSTPSLSSSSSPSSSSLATPSNQTNISDAEWITHSISLIMFLTAFVGNTAALIVMFASRGPIRLTNNKYLANLACADLLRACFIPFTIIARMKRNFIFGGVICKILPIVQGLGVSVDVFTLVCISIERYLAICHPLLTLKLQSVPHTNLFSFAVLLTIWTLGLVSALPNYFLYNLCILPKIRRHKCEMSGSQYFDERAYIVALDVFYFVIPMTVMIFLYTLIILKMSQNNTATQMRSHQNSNRHGNHSISSPGPLVPQNSTDRQHQGDVPRSRFSRRFRFLATSTFRKSNRGSTSSYARMDRQRRKALKLLIVLIVEFFVCWTPLYIYHTIGTFNKGFYRYVPSVFLDLILLFSFASASCNPLTYYFMSQRYRTVLYANITALCYQKNASFLIYQKQRPTHQASKPAATPGALLPRNNSSNNRFKDDPQ